MNPYKNILFSFLLILSSNAFAQIDNKTGTHKKGKKKSILAVPSKKIKKPKSLKNGSNDGFKKAYDKEKKKLAKKKIEEDLKKKGILSSARVAEERYLKSFKKINGRFQYPKIDQDLGSFRTQSKSVRIVCRDFQYPDGDRVSIMINGIPVIKNITLRQAFQSFDLATGAKATILIAKDK